MMKRCLLLSIFLFGLVLHAAAGEKSDKTKPCKKLPEPVSSREFTKDEIAAYMKQIKSDRIRGTLTFAVNEAGETTKIKVVSVSPKSAADYLSEAVRRMRFKPRPGCGDFPSEVNFDLRN